MRYLLSGDVERHSAGPSPRPSQARWPSGSSASCPRTVLAAPATVVLMPFSYVDTSGEPRDQATEHGARLALMAE